jgi:hypothetical protein
VDQKLGKVDGRKQWKIKRERLRDPDKKAARIAGRQWGAFTRQQAISAGLTRNQVAYRVLSGQWRQPARGVFVIAGVPHSWEQKSMIACLAGPPKTVVSHLTAAALFGLAKPPTEPHVTVPLRASGRFDGAEIFRGSFGPGETCTRRRIPCTSPTRTILDCAAAGLLDVEDIWNLVDSALCKKLMQPSRLIRASGHAWGQARGRRRARLERLERALDVWRSGLPAGSPPEARLQRKDRLDEISRTRFGGTVPPKRVGDHLARAS